METYDNQQVPVNILWDKILFASVQGTLDSRRTQKMMDAVLSKILETGGSTFILDILGVAVVDSAVAKNLIKMGQATRLMGCEMIISGISPEIAQTIVQLGVDLGDTSTTATIKDAFSKALQTTGQTVIQLEPA